MDPASLSTTPGGTIYGVTPGGTRIVYNRDAILNLSKSPLSQTPPNFAIPAELLSTSPTESPSLEESWKEKAEGGKKKDVEFMDEEVFDMED